jgi:hypothetical protein
MRMAAAGRQPASFGCSAHAPTPGLPVEEGTDAFSLSAVAAAGRECRPDQIKEIVALDDADMRIRGPRSPKFLDSVR